MILYANNDRFEIRRGRQIIIIPVCDVVKFWMSGSVFNIRVLNMKPFTFDYSEITHYNGTTTIPAMAALVKDFNVFLDKECRQ